VLEDASSHLAFQVVKEWIQDCLICHEQCQQIFQADSPGLPLRVIDVGAGTSDPHLQVTNAGHKGLYTTLSWCWGNFVPLKTTKSTLKEREQQIPMSSLPKTFKDAVAITRYLGVRYLWIDALCILQDCEDDWRVQSANMAQIYKNSFITIGAADSEDSRGGCFIPRPPMTRLKVKPLDSPNELFFARLSPDGPLSDRRTKLDSRAWCFQEMVLSPRVLLYGRQMMGWLCNSTQLHENSQSPIFLQREGMRLLSVRGQLTSISSWMRLVEEYTSRDLTLERDKLPAISGLASEFQRLTKDYYIAGLWRKDLLVLLLWHIQFKSSKMKSGRTTQYQAPSWSWASLNDAIAYDAVNEKFSTHDAVSRVKYAYVQPAGPDLFGQVIHGRIWLLGPLFEVEWSDICQVTHPKSRQQFISLNLRGSSTYRQKWDGVCRFDVLSESRPKIWCLQMTRTVDLLLEAVDLKILEFRRLGISIASRERSIVTDIVKLITVI
jgi:hypothetical protein